MDNLVAMVCMHTVSHIAISLRYNAGTFHFNVSKVPHGILYNEGHYILYLHL